MKFRSNFQLFAAPDDQQGIEQAKEYVQKYDIKDKIKIVRLNNQILVVTKTEMKLK